MFWMAAAYFGAAVLAYHALALLNVLYKTLLASGPKLTKKYGEWAVVTGATDGVGKAMCFELARKGCRRALRPVCIALGVAPDASAAVCALHSVMLISRSEAKLKAVKAELVEQYPSVKVPTPHSHRHSRPTPPSPVVVWRLSPLDNSLSTDPSLAPSRFPRDDSAVLPPTPTPLPDSYRWTTLWPTSPS